MGRGGTYAKKEGGEGEKGKGKRVRGPRARDVSGLEVATCPIENTSLQTALALCFCLLRFLLRPPAQVGHLSDTSYAYSTTMADDPPSASSLLHLLAAASSDLPPGTQRISASYHLHELPANPAAASSTTPAVAGAAAQPSTGSVDVSPSNARKRKADSLTPPEGPSAAGAAAGARDDTPGSTTTTGAEAGSSLAADQAKKVVKNGNNKVTLSCAECRRREFHPFLFLWFELKRSSLREAFL